MYVFCTTQKTFLCLNEVGKLYNTFSNLKIVTDACCRVTHTDQTLYKHNAKGRSASGYVFLDSEDCVVETGVNYIGNCSVAEAEYLGIIFALENAAVYCRKNIEVWLDNEVIVGQLNGDFCLRVPKIRKLFDQIKILEMRFVCPVKYYYHNRGSYWAREADMLANSEYSRIHRG